MCRLATSQKEGGRAIRISLEANRLSLRPQFSQRRYDMSMQQQPAVVAQSRWVFDPFHTQVDFAAKHLGMMTVRGNFPELTATGYIDPDHPEASAAEVTVQTASLRTNNSQRDNDLRSSSFLEVDRHPTITFKSTKIEQTRL